MIHIGTSGFKFDDWKGEFYPAGVPQKDWLNYYATQFDTLEINASYYRLFNAATFYQMARKVPDNFRFCVKAYRTLTHETEYGTADDWRAFLDSLAPLEESGKFGCVLAQFPTSFRNTPARLDYLQKFFEQVQPRPLVVEFRHRDWLTEDTFAWLTERRIGFCSVDEPQFSSLMPPVVRATAPIGYVRFHGRNYKEWWSGEKDRRYDYLYNEEELKEWVPKIEELAGLTDRTFVFMNNCFKAKAAINALQLKVLVEDGDIEPGKTPAPKIGRPQQNLDL
jgi:uncharacterized protein YecE (DUF72 family)